MCANFGNESGAANPYNYFGEAARRVDTTPRVRDDDDDDDGGLDGKRRLWKRERYFLRIPTEVTRPTDDNTCQFCGSQEAYSCTIVVANFDYGFLKI